MEDAGKGIFHFFMPHSQADSPRPAGVSDPHGDAFALPPPGKGGPKGRKGGAKSTSG